MDFLGGFIRKKVFYLFYFFSFIFAISPWFGSISNKIDRISSFFPIFFPLLVIAVYLGFRDRPLLNLSLGCLILFTAGTTLAPEFFVSNDKILSKGKQLFIISHNLKRLNFDARQTASELVSSNADILILQEWSDRLEPFRNQILTRFPFVAECEKGDVIIFSRLALGKTQCRTIKPLWANQVLLLSEIKLNDKSAATLASWHPSWKLSRGHRQVTRRNLIEVFNEFESTRAILAGDFNMTPWNSGMRELQAELSPLRRITHAQFTFPARVRSVEWPFALLPIDHIFVGPAWSAISVHRMPRTGSDHYPLITHLQLREGY